MFGRLAAYMERRTLSAEAATEASTRANLTNIEIEILQLQSAITRCEHEERLSSTNAEVAQLEGQRLMEKPRLGLPGTEILRARHDLKACRNREEECRIKAAKARSEIIALEESIDAKRKQIRDPLEQCMQRERELGEDTSEAQPSVLKLQKELRECKAEIAKILRLQSTIAAIADSKSRKELYKRSVALLDSLRKEESYTQSELKACIEELDMLRAEKEKARRERQNLEKLMHECAIGAEALWLERQALEESVNNEEGAPANATNQCDTQVASMLSATQASNDNHVQYCALQ